MRLVLVEWIDSYGCSTNWRRMEECEPAILSCRSVGWLLHDGDDAKVIVPHIADAEPEIHRQGCGDMTIPTKAITKIVDITLPA